MIIPTENLVMTPFFLSSKVLALIGSLMSLVSAENQPVLSTSAVLFLVQRSHWETLVTGLLQVANRLFPTCSEEFRDKSEPCLLNDLFF